MAATPIVPGHNGMEVTNIHGNAAFLARPIRPHSPQLEIEAMQSLAQLFVASPTKILRELVHAAVAVCSAESAGITLEERLPGGDLQFRWIATAGAYAPYLDAVLEGCFSPCQICLDRHQPQHLRIFRRYLDSIGVDAPEIPDGLLIPWQVDDLRGTIWALSHTSSSFFDREDLRILQSLSWFAAIAVRHQAEQRLLLEKAASDAAADVARNLAHEINNPLQSLINLDYLARHAPTPPTENLADHSAAALTRLTTLVQELLNRPKAS